MVIRRSSVLVVRSRSGVIEAIWNMIWNGKTPSWAGAV
jgi:hypothetical protein